MMRQHCTKIKYSHAIYGSILMDIGAKLAWQKATKENLLYPIKYYDKVHKPLFI